MRARAQAPTNSRKKDPPRNPFISTVEEKETLVQPIRRRYGSEAEFFVPHRRGLIRPRGRGYSYFRRFSCNAFIRAARFNGGCGAPRAKSGNARGKLPFLSLTLSLCPSLRFCAHRETRRVSSGITQLCKAGGVPRHLLATGDPAGLSCKAQLRSFDYFI